MEQLLSSFGLRSVAVLRPASPNGWLVEAHAGEAVLERPEDATATSELPGDAQFVYDGPDLTGDDRRVLNAFVSQLAVALASRELRAEASAAGRGRGGRRVAHGLAARGVARPAYAPRIDQGVGIDVVGRRSPPRRRHGVPAAPDDRRRGRPAQRDRQQPARDEPVAGGCVAARLHRCRHRRDRRARARQPGRPGRGSRGRRSRFAAARARRSRARRTRAGERRRQRARRGRLRSNLFDSRARFWAAMSCSA